MINLLIHNNLKNIFNAAQQKTTFFWLSFWFLLTVIPVSCSANLKGVTGAKESSEEGFVAITRNGKSLIPVVLPASTTPQTEQAAKDLIDYIKKISGAEMQIIRGFPNPVPESALWIGIQPGLNQIFPKENLGFLHPEEILILVKNNHILIAGRDRFNPDILWAKDQFNRKTITGIQQEYGTCNAVYTFLQDQLGVRWLWPGSLGEDYPAEPDIALPSQSYRYHPDISDRSGILYRLSLTTNKESTAERNWARYQRSRLSSMDLFRVHHAFTEWWNRYHQTYPAIFALQANGERTFKSDPKYVKICQSNPMVWTLWLKEVAVQLERNPNQSAFNASSNDGWTFGHCTCDNCRSWDGPGFSWKNPNLSDREVHFANILAEKLEAAYPGKNYKVIIGAYGYTRPAPVKERPSSQVIVMNVANFLMRAQAPDEDRKLAKKQYADWSKITDQMTWRPNLGNPVGGQAGFPDIAPHQAAQDIRYVDSLGCIGLFFDTYWGHWANQGIQYYTLTQVAWNPHLKVDSLLDDYYQRAYGAAAKTMKQYWNLLETTRNDFAQEEKSRFRFLMIYNKYDDKWFVKANKLLEQAKATVKDHNPKYQKRIDFAAFGLAYAELIVKIRKQMALWEKDSKNVLARQQVLDYWNEMKDLEKKAPPYAINFNVTFAKPRNRAMKGLHPLNAISKKMKMSMQNAEGYE